MSAFRVLNQAPQYLLPDGRVNGGGKLFFYLTDLTTPADTWSNDLMTVVNANPVIMDAAGRTTTDVWGLGEYGVVMTDAADVVIWTRNNVAAAGDIATEIPALQDGKFLTNNGSALLWGEVSQVPDPTAHANDILYSDGALAFWGPPAAAPVAPTLDQAIGTTTLRVGKFLIQTGSDTAPVSAARTTSKNIAFGTSYSSILAVSVMVNVNVVGVGVGVTSAATGYVPGSASTGFTAEFNSADDGGASGFSIDNPVTFNWVSFGLIP